MRERERGVYYKELAHTGWRPRSTYVSAQVQRQETTQLKAVRQEEFLYSRRVSLFVLFRPSTDRMGPTLIGEGSLL